MERSGKSGQQKFANANEIYQVLRIIEYYNAGLSVLIMSLPKRVTICQG